MQLLLFSIKQQVTISPYLFIFSMKIHRPFISSRVISCLQSLNHCLTLTFPSTSSAWVFNLRPVYRARILRTAAAYQFKPALLPLLQTNTSKDKRIWRTNVTLEKNVSLPRRSCVMLREGSQRPLTSEKPSRWFPRVSAPDRQTDADEGKEVRVMLEAKSLQSTVHFFSSWCFYLDNGYLVHLTFF